MFLVIPCTELFAICDITKHFHAIFMSDEKFLSLSLDLEILNL